MSERNPTIPFGNFYHPPMNLPEVMIEYGCDNATDLAVMHGLIRLVQRHKMVKVGKYDPFTGDTCVVSHEKLAEKCFFNEKTIRRSIERLKDAGLIVQHKQGKCFWYHITIYDKAIEYMKSNPDYPMETISNPVGSQAKRQAIYDEMKQTDLKSNIESNSDFLPTNSDTVSHNSDLKSRSQESFQDNLQEPPSLNTNGDSTRMSESNERGGDFSNHEEPEEVITFDDGEVDIQPTKEIADYTDTLAEAKGMTPNEDEQEPVWAFMNVFKRSDGEEWRQSDVQSATILRERFESVLETHSLNITPIRFFEYCLTETDNWIADGKVDVAPSSFNFYLNAATGKQIVDCVAEKLKSESNHQSDLERTDARLDEIKEFKREGIPPEAQAMLDELLGREDNSEI